MSSLTLLQFTPLIYGMAYLMCISAVLVSFCWSLWKTFNQGWQHVYRLHQIPCHRCVFFTGDYRLKCAVDPFKALNEDAINCINYEAEIGNNRVAPTE
jgi:hypothetical protein